MFNNYCIHIQNFQEVLPTQYVFTQKFKYKIITKYEHVLYRQIIINGSCVGSKSSQTSFYRYHNDRLCIARSSRIATLAVVIGTLSHMTVCVYGCEHIRTLSLCLVIHANRYPNMFFQKYISFHNR